MVTLLHGDSLTVLPTLPANSFDSCVTDPPYELAFMGKRWDATGIAYSLRFWQEVLRVLKPGAYLLAFGGTRTQHRMVCAIEDAGFTVYSMLAWIQGQGFPKATKTDREGWFYGRQALKPSMEPICMAQKPPSEKRMADNIVKWGTGAVNITVCRVAGEPWTRSTPSRDNIRGGGFVKGATRTEACEPKLCNPAGRWPPNTLFSDEAAAVLGEPARFFPVFHYCAKASRKDRGEGNTHPTVKPLDLMRWLVRLVTPPGGMVLDPFAGSGTTLLACQREGFSCVGIELEPAYCDIANRRLQAASS